ncbi:MAG: hypothetical protein PHW74_06440 [Desulfobacca sp.]|nr:hypothetical protein [Desulfobacca sp.]
MAYPSPKKFWHWLKDFLSGFLFGGLIRTAREEKQGYQDLFMVLTLGQMLGIPLMGNYYALRLLPFQVKELSAWQRRLLRDQDLLELFAE